MLDSEMTNDQKDRPHESAQCGKRAQSSLHSRSSSPVSDQPVSGAHKDKRLRQDSPSPPQPTNFNKEPPPSPPNSMQPEEDVCCDEDPSPLDLQKPQEQVGWEIQARMHGLLKPPFYAVTYACSKETEDIPIGLMEIFTSYDLARKYALRLMHWEFRRIHGKSWEEVFGGNTGSELLVCTSKEKRTGQTWVAEWTYGDYYHQFVDVTPWTPATQMTRSYRLPSRTDSSG